MIPGRLIDVCGDDEEVKVCGGDGILRGNYGEKNNQGSYLLVT